MPDFAAFWSAYPRKTAKGEAMKAFVALRPDPDLMHRILGALEWQRTQPGWLKDGGKFVPHPATWLRARRWEDEPFHPPDASDSAFERVVAGKGRLQ